MKQPEALRLAKILDNIEGYRATLAAAAELRRLHEANQAMVDIHEAVLDEREACAKVCEGHNRDGDWFANAIRARGETK